MASQWRHMSVIPSQMTGSATVVQQLLQANTMTTSTFCTTELSRRESTGDRWTLYEGNPLVANGFLSQRASNAEVIPCHEVMMVHSDGPLARYVKLRVAHTSGLPGSLSLPLRVSDPDMHYGTCVTHVPWCMPGSLTSGFLWSLWQGKRSLHSRRMRNLEFYVSDKRQWLEFSEGCLERTPWLLCCHDANNKLKQPLYTVSDTRW